MSSKIDEVALWLKNTIKLLVDFPEEVRIDVIKGEAVTLLSCKVSPDDMGKLIGKSGLTADALRGLLHSFAGKLRVKFVLNIETKN